MFFKIKTTRAKSNFTIILKGPNVLKCKKKKKRKDKKQSLRKREVNGHGLPRLIVSSVIFLPLLVNSSSIS